MNEKIANKDLKIDLHIHLSASSYKDYEFAVINCVSDCLEDQIESLKRRWKRYGKNIKCS